MVVASAFSAPLSFSFASCHRTSSLHLFSLRNPSSKSTVSALQSPYGDSLTTGLSSRTCGSPLKLDVKDFGDTSTSYGAIEARKGNPPILPAVMTPGGPLDLSSVLFRNRIIFIGQPVNSLVAQRVISQLVTLATVDENADILIKPKVGTVCFGVAASQGALLLAGGEKGMRYAMPNARIMIHQPQSGCGGHVEDVRRQVNEAVQTRHKVDNMYVAFTGQSLEKVQQYTERDRFLSVSEAMEFGLIDGVLETEY
ncbi:ATP-dependent Clp protease proteolytic subunit 6, chloroplastic isoform X2 [Prunus dulcis]|uniref:ATP-dependent Clp protease proteolytic subunit 6, chloroplastic isoform X2 n=1 Tax=Prunus dulcis TaxID=3755 RepID=UPI0014835EEB|nr:ATP-dependent Clp protease proteolytic subunit 6, chloroplastic isoform X2 [Prunus dulcis]